MAEAKAPRDHVYRAWTQRLSEWWAPKPRTTAAQRAALAGER